MANKVGPLIKQARTDAGMTQEQLARKIKGISANDISRAERGEAELTQAVLKEIARETGVTQSSLIEAAKASTYKKGSTSSSSSSSGTSIKVTNAEKEIIRLYREADSDTKKAVRAMLKGTSNDPSDILEGILGQAVEMFLKNK